MTTVRPVSPRPATPAATPAGGTPAPVADAAAVGTTAPARDAFVSGGTPLHTPATRAQPAAAAPAPSTVGLYQAVLATVSGRQARLQAPDRVLAQVLDLTQARMPTAVAALKAVLELPWPPDADLPRFVALARVAGHAPLPQAALQVCQRALKQKQVRPAVLQAFEAAAELGADSLLAQLQSRREVDRVAGFHRIADQRLEVEPPALAERIETALREGSADEKNAALRAATTLPPAECLPIVTTALAYLATLDTSPPVPLVDMTQLLAVLERAKPDETTLKRFYATVLSPASTPQQHAAALSALPQWQLSAASNASILDTSVQAWPASIAVVARLVSQLALPNGVAERVVNDVAAYAADPARFLARSGRTIGDDVDTHRLVAHQAHLTALLSVGQRDTFLSVVKTLATGDAVERSAIVDSIGALPSDVRAAIAQPLLALDLGPALGARVTEELVMAEAPNARFALLQRLVADPRLANHVPAALAVAGLAPSDNAELVQQALLQPAALSLVAQHLPRIALDHTAVHAAADRIIDSNDVAAQRALLKATITPDGAAADGQFGVPTSAVLPLLKKALVTSSDNPLLPYALSALSAPHYQAALGFSPSAALTTLQEALAQVVATDVLRSTTPPRDVKARVKASPLADPWVLEGIARAALALNDPQHERDAHLALVHSDRPEGMYYFGLLVGRLDADEQAACLEPIHEAFDRMLDLGFASVGDELQSQVEGRALALSQQQAAVQLEQQRANAMTATPADALASSLLSARSANSDALLEQMRSPSTDDVAVLEQVWLQLVAHDNGHTLTLRDYDAQIAQKAAGLRRGSPDAVSYGGQWLKPVTTAQNPSRVPLLASSQLMDVPSTVHNRKLVADALATGRPLWLRGEPGEGKTAVVKEACATLGRALNIVPCNSFMTARQLLGQMTTNGFAPGLLLQAAINGEVLLLDEADTLDAAVLTAINSLLDDRGCLTVPGFNNGLPFRPASGFAIFATGNGTGMLHGNRNAVDPATLSRFRFAEVKSLGFDEIEAVVEKKFGDRIASADLQSLLNVHKACKTAQRNEALGDDYHGFPAFTLRDVLRACKRMALAQRDAQGNRLQDVPRRQALTRAALESVYLQRFAPGTFEGRDDRATLSALLDAACPASHEAVEAAIGFRYDADNCVVLEQVEGGYRLGDVFIPRVRDAAPAGLAPKLDRDITLTPRMAYALREMALAHQAGENFMLVGERAAGKTVLAAFYARLTGQAYGEKVFERDTRPQHLVGQFDINGTWTDGPLTRVLRERGMFVWDEWSVAAAELRARFNGVLGGDEHFTLIERGGAIHRDPHSGVERIEVENLALGSPIFHVATMNPPGYEGRQHFSAAELNRWSAMWLDNPSIEELKVILRADTQLRLLDRDLAVDYTAPIVEFTEWVNRLAQARLIQSEENDGPIQHGMRTLKDILNTLARELGLWEMNDVVEQQADGTSKRVSKFGPSAQLAAEDDATRQAILARLAPQVDEALSHTLLRVFSFSSDDDRRLIAQGVEALFGATTDLNGTDRDRLEAVQRTLT